MNAAFGHSWRKQLSGHTQFVILNLKCNCVHIRSKRQQAWSPVSPVMCYNVAQRPWLDFSPLSPFSPLPPSWLPQSSLQSFLGPSSSHPTCLLLTSPTASCFLSQKHKDQCGREGYLLEGSEWEDEEIESLTNSGRGKTRTADRLIITVLPL